MAHDLEAGAAGNERVDIGEKVGKTEFIGVVVEQPAHVVAHAGDAAIDA